MPTTVFLRLRLHDIVLRYLRNSEIRREGPRAWNHLPTELVLMRYTSVFKSSLKTFLLQTAYCS